MRTAVKIVIGTVFVCAAIIVFFLFAPWKVQAAKEIVAILQRNGFQNVRLSLHELSPFSADLEGVSIGSGVTLRDLHLTYSPFALRKGRLNEITADGLSLTLTQAAGKWQINGYRAPENPSSPSSFHLPVSEEQLSLLPFTSLEAKNAHLTVADNAGLNLSATLAMALKLGATPGMTIDLSGFAAHSGNNSIETSGKLSGGLQDGAWRGDWRLDNISLSHGDDALPGLSGKGQFVAGAEKFSVGGEVISQDRSYDATFELTASYAGKDAVLKIARLKLPWKGGRFSVENVLMPLNTPKPVGFILHVEQVSIAALLRSLTGKDIVATGNISGDIPLSVGRDGTITVAQGNLTAAGPGTLSLPPDLIPGDNPQVAAVREILKDFHYTNLVLKADGGGAKTIGVGISVQGNNPGVYDGRSVNLNIKLSGDVLNLVKQNMMLFTNPKAMINQP